MRILNISLIMALFCVFQTTAVRAQETNHTSITVVLDDNYPPYVFRGADGAVQGILPDQWALWSRKTGVSVDLRAMDWGAALRAMREGRADVIDTAFYTPERDLYMDFSNPYAEIEVPVFFDKSLSGIGGVRDLRGFVVGVKDGDACIDILEKHGVSSLKKYPSYESIVHAAGEGEIHVFCIDKPPAVYYLYRAGLETAFRHSLSLYTGRFHRAVREGDAATLELLNRGFSAITEDEYREIREKWMGTDVVRLELPDYFYPVVIAATIAALLMLLLNLLLRRRLKERNLMLRRTVDELRASEARTRALVDANPDMLFIFDADGTYLEFRVPSETVLAVEPERVKGRRVSEVLPGPLAEEALVKIREVIATRRPQSFEYELMTQQGMMYCDARLVPFDGRCLAIVRDSTDRRRRLDEEIRNNKLESLGVFAGGLAHDFNNILAALIGNISLARMLLDDRKQAEPILDEAERAGLRARRLTDQLLAFAKGGAPVKVVFDAAAMMREAAEFVLSGSATTIEYSLEADAPQIEADRGQIAQVIQNIVLNASQAMGGGGVVHMGLGPLVLQEKNPNGLEPGRYLRITIADTGEGIDAGTLQRIFDPYFTTKKSGTGLGLAICHSIIKRHGGDITVRSDRERGTVFEILIPVGSAAGTSDDSSMPVTADADLAGKTVLVIDDEAPVRDVIRAILEQRGMRVIGAKSTEDALSRVGNGGIDLVLIDLTIPGGTGGPDGIRLLRERGLEFAAVLTTGYTDSPVVREYRASGFASCLTKPFSVHELMLAVQTALAAR